MNTMKPYKRRVYYYETDKMGIMHHSNYIRIFEESRVDFLIQAGMPMEKIEAQGILMPVLSVDCRYKSPLRFDEEFAVYPKIVKFNGTTLEIEYRVVSCDSGLLCVEGSSSHCFTDNDLKPVRTKRNFPDICQLFESHKNAEIQE